MYDYDNDMSIPEESRKNMDLPAIEGAVDEPIEEFIAAEPLRPCTEPWLPKNCCCPE